MAAPARRKCHGGAAVDHVRVLHHPDLFRYVLNNPVGWTEEVIVTAWLWTVLWGAAFVIREEEEIRFDIIYSNLSERTRRVLTVITGIVLVVLYGISLPASYTYVSFMKVERSAYLHVPINWCTRSTSSSPSACIGRYCWLIVARRPRRQAAADRCREVERLTMPLSPFALCIITIVALGALGLPIGHSMIVASIFYLLLSGLDLGTAAEQILNGLFNSYVLLAIPLFILAADLMNIGSLTDRLLQFCLVLVGRFRGGLGHVNVVANMIFAGMSGSAIADAVGIGRIIIGMMTKDGRYPVAYAGAITASAAIIGPIIPPSIPMVLYALISDTSIGYLFLGGFVPGVMLGIVFMVMNSIIARRRNYPVEPPIPLREIPEDHAARVSRADAAGHPAVRHLWRRDDADRRRRGRGLLRAVRLDRALSRGDLEAALRGDPRPAGRRRPRSAC